MKKLRILTLAMLLAIPSAKAVNPYWALNVAAGYNTVGMSSELIDNVRAYQSDYGWDFDFITENTESGYVSVAPEYYFNNKISLSGGLRLSLAHSRFCSDNDFFYYKLKEEGYNTYYYCVSSIDQHNFFAGIPIEFRFTTRGEGRPSPYIRAGVTFNLNIANITTVHMHNSNTDNVKNKIRDKVEHPTDFSMPVYAAAGWMFGRKNSISVEMQFPYTIAVGSISAFGATNNVGIGFQITYQIAKNGTKTE